MKKIGIVSYNRYCNFTNYGSALQSWALYHAIEKLKIPDCQPILMNYCPDILKKLNPLDPFKNMWDKDEESQKECRDSLTAIRINYDKFEKFYNEEFVSSAKCDKNNFDEVCKIENINSFVCGSDTIFCKEEFGIEDGFFANYETMKNGYSFSYAASFGDSVYNGEDKDILIDRLNNFKNLSFREPDYINDLQPFVSANICRVLDPTLLLDKEDYKPLIKNCILDKRYLLLYARRYNPAMEKYAEKIAKQNNLEIIEISLRARNKAKHKMFYEAGVEEFLGLINNAQFVVTNSYHGFIFSIIFEKQCVIFSREQCSNKIKKLLEIMGCSDRLLVSGEEILNPLNFLQIKNNLLELQKKSWNYLKKSCEESINEHNKRQ